MASDLSPLWEQGGEPVGAGPKDDESDAGSKAKSKASSKSKPKATRAKRGQGANLSTGFNNWKHTPENHLKDLMEFAEPNKCGRSHLNTLNSSQIRAGFFGMFRKGPYQTLDSLNKQELCQILQKEYQRIGAPLAKPEKTLLGLVRDVEIELSRNDNFKIMKLSDGSQMIECRGVVKSLPPAKNGEWVIKRAAGSDIPYVSDGEAGTKKWCMEFFQAATATGGKTDGISDMPPSLDLNQVTEAPSSSSGVAVPQSDMKQLPPGPATITKKSMQPVCYCDLDLAACGSCGKGYAQEIAQGRAPRFIEIEVKPEPSASEPLEDAPSGTFRIRKKPVCDCGLSRGECPDCKNGFMEVTLRGIAPKFVDEKVPTKKVPVCKCQEEKAECSTCSQGYMERTKAGSAPFFKEVDVIPEKKDQEVPDKKKTESKVEPEGVAPGTAPAAASPAAAGATKGSDGQAGNEKKDDKSTAEEPPEKKARVDPGEPDCKTPAKTGKLAFPPQGAKK